MPNHKGNRNRAFALNDRVSYSGQGKRLFGTITKLYELEKLPRYVVDFDDGTNGVFYENELELLQGSKNESA